MQDVTAVSESADEPILTAVSISERSSLRIYHTCVCIAASCYVPEVHKQIM